MKGSLFPRKFKFAGYVLIVLGFISGYLYFLGGKPDFLTLPIFAAITSYAETRYMVLAQTNLLDEISAVFILIGLIFVGFSEVKNESAEIKSIRIKALILSVYSTTVFWIIVFLLIYGWTIFIFSTFVFYVYLLIYISIFNYLLFKLKSEILKTN